MRSHHRLLIAGGAMCALAATASTAAGQTRSTWSVQGSALYAGLGGKPFSGINNGEGFEIQGRRKIDPYWSLGCGVLGTYHSLESLSGSARLEGAFCEPRRLVDINSETIFPYLSARLSLLRQKVASGDFSKSAKGVTLNLGAGIVRPIANTRGRYPTLLEIGASGGYTRFGHFSRNLGNATGNDTQQSGGGWNFVVRLGVVVGLPFGDSAP